MSDPQLMWKKKFTREQPFTGCAFLGLRAASERFAACTTLRGKRAAGSRYLKVLAEASCELEYGHSCHGLSSVEGQPFRSFRELPQGKNGRFMSDLWPKGSRIVMFMSQSAFFEELQSKDMATRVNTKNLA